jgi:hypothetical protein
MAHQSYQTRYFRSICYDEDLSLLSALDPAQIYSPVILIPIKV